MSNFTVVFSHGRESGPWGTKIRALAKVAESLGCYVISRDDSDTTDPELRVARLIEEAQSIDGPIVLVGSSMGGYVAAMASKSIEPVGLFLMAPAFGLAGYAERSPDISCRELAVVHGWGDDIVPLEPVLAFADNHKAMMHLLPAGHALTEQVEWITDAFELFLRRCFESDVAGSRERLLSTF